MISTLKVNNGFIVFRDNSKLCSCGGDRQIFYWDVSTGRVIRKFRGHDSEVCFFTLEIDFVSLIMISQFVEFFIFSLFGFGAG